MNISSQILHVGSMKILLTRKPIKNIHLSVLPPNGTLRVTSPLNVKEDTIRLLVATKIPWIRKQRAKFEGQRRQTPREYVSGETHYVFGRPHRLEVLYESGSPTVAVKGNQKIILRVRPNTSLDKREAVLLQWYRNELRGVSAKLLEKWQQKIGISPAAWDIKRMKTRWGTCNQKAGRIWLNLELAKKPIQCLEYVIVHELLHLVERRHNRRFVELMAAYQPKWRTTKEELNRFILSHENWPEFATSPEPN